MITLAWVARGAARKCIKLWSQTLENILTRRTGKGYSDQGKSTRKGLSVGKWMASLGHQIWWL